MSTVLSRLRPTERELEELARRQTDPRLYDDFTPIARGVVFAAVALVSIGLAAIVCTPFRLVRQRR